jgi:hypothetical protein
LLGDKGHQWLTATVGSLNLVRVLAPAGEGALAARLLRANAPLSKKLKLLAILLNIVTRHLMAAAPDETARFVQLALSAGPPTPVAPGAQDDAPMGGPVVRHVGALSLPASGLFEGALLAHIQSESQVGRPLHGWRPTMRRAHGLLGQRVVCVGGGVWGGVGGGGGGCGSQR